MYYDWTPSSGVQIFLRILVPEAQKCILMQLGKKLKKHTGVVLQDNFLLSYMYIGLEK